MANVPGNVVAPSFQLSCKKFIYFLLNIIILQKYTIQREKNKNEIYNVIGNSIQTNGNRVTRVSSLSSRY